MTTTAVGGEPGAPAAGRDDGARVPRRPGDVTSFGVGLVAGQALSAATTPLFTRALGPADFGALDVLTVVVTLLSTLLLAGLDQAVVRSFYDDRSEAAQRALVRSGFTFVLITGLLGCGTALLFTSPLARALLHRAGYGPVLVAALVGVPPAIGVAYATEVLRLHGRAGPYALSGILRALVGGAVGAWLTLVAHLGARGALVGLAAGSMVALMYDVAAARRLLGIQLDRRPLGRMVRFGLPLVPTGVALWSLMVVDRLVLVRHVSLRQVGIYALAAKIAVLLLWAVNGFKAGWTATIIEVHGRDPVEARNRRARALVDATAVAVGLAAVVGALCAELTALAGGPGYEPAVRVVPVLLLALVLFSTTSVTQSAMLISRRTGLMARHTLAAAGVNLAACFLLVPRWGIDGAAAATLVGFAYLAVAFYLSAQRIDPVAYEPLKAAAVGAIVLPYLALGQVTVGPLAVSVTLKLVCLAAVPPLLRRLGAPVPRLSTTAVSVVRRLQAPGAAR
jgi:O-antigen/teichoic acid export membrane protein